jgi:hypothetical protein
MECRRRRRRGGHGPWTVLCCFLAKAGAWRAHIFIHHHHLRISALRRARMTGGPPFAGGSHFRAHYGGWTQTVGNLADGHVIYPIAACKKYSSSLPRIFDLTYLDAWMDDTIHSLSTCVNVMRRCGVYLALHSVSDSSSLWRLPQWVRGLS